MAISLVEQMPKREFYEKIFSGPVKTMEFSYLITGGIAHTSPEERETVRKGLVAVGIPPSEVDTDEKLYTLARAIVARAVNVR